jgi:hypothetical protein
MKRRQRYSTCRSDDPFAPVARSRVAAYIDGSERRNGGDEWCGYHERRAGAPTFRLGKLSVLTILACCRRSRGSRVDHHCRIAARRLCSQGSLRSASASLCCHCRRGWSEHTGGRISLHPSALTLDLRVQFRPGEDDICSQIEPEQQNNNDGPKRAVGLVVAADLRDVGGEGGRAQNP